MHSTVFILFTAAVLLHEVNGHIFQRAIPHVLSKNVELPKNYKRQTDTDPGQCLEDKVNATFQGDTSTLANGCRRIADTQVTTVADFQAFCNPECGNVVLDAADECKVFDGPEGAQVRDGTVGVCGTNSNGTKCYQVLLSANINIGNCYAAFVANSSTCNCRSELSQLTINYGCCLGVLYDVLASVYNQTTLRELYSVCGVDYPTACTNSPLSGVVPSVVPEVSPDQCVEDKVNAAFEESSSAIGAACKQVLSVEVTLDGFRTYCNPECGSVIFDALDECNFFEQAGGLSGFRDYYIDICGTNSNGKKCYELAYVDLYSNNEGYSTDISNCIDTFLTSGECNCRSELLELEGEYGCCLNVFYDFIAATSHKVLNVFHDACDVNYPSRCNNSPIMQDGGFMPQVALVSLISALVFSVVLG